MYGRMNAETVQEINRRLFFGSGNVKMKSELKPWQYVEMEYERIGLRAPADVPDLESQEDADIWMCLDDRVNRILRMRASALAG